MIETTEYIRIPSPVAAVQVTLENMEELAAFLGTVHIKDDSGVPYIQTDERVPFADKVWEGYWVTFMHKDRVRAYTPKYFERNFVVNDNAVRAFVTTLTSKENAEETS